MHTVVCPLGAPVFPSVVWGSNTWKGGCENYDIMNAEYSVECQVCRKCSTRSQLLSTGWPWDDSDESLTTPEAIPCWCSLVKPEWSCPGKKQLGGSSGPVMWSICSWNSTSEPLLKQLHSV